MTDAVEALLADPARALVAIDFDGTLAPIVERPQDARLAPGARDVLVSLARSVGTVAIVSGRAAREVVELGGLSDIRGLRVLGHYGLDSWYDGSLDSPPPVPGVARAREQLPELLSGADPGVAIEDKGQSVAVHTRRAAAPAVELERLAPRLRQLAAECRLEAVPGRYVLELRPPGVDKGAALRRLVDDADATVVVYLGDDLGDLPAFDVVDDLVAAGRVAGLTVASGDPADGDAPPELAERAGLSLAGPTAVVAWLAGLAAMLAS
jgi:trehalose 6-phosphate phosphatase